jgi:hypothetical protein
LAFRNLLRNGNELSISQYVSFGCSLTIRKK